MGTSRSEEEAALDEASRASPPSDTGVAITPEPTAAEAAAIAAAIQRYLRVTATEAESGDRTAWWREHAWRLTGRFETAQPGDGRPRSDLPTDAWRARDRARRL